MDQLYAPEIAQAAPEWVAPFRAAFPDVTMETLAMVGEGDTVVGRFRCSGTQTGPWMGRAGTGRAFRDVREVYWVTVRGGRINDWWGSRTTTTDGVSCGRSVRTDQPGNGALEELRRARRVHDERHADEADERAGHVETVGTEPVGDHAPDEAAGDEDSTVRGEDPAEVGVGLQRGHESVHTQRDDPEPRPQPAPILTDALLDQPGTADLGDGSHDEQQDRADNRHGGEDASSTRHGLAR